MGDDLVRQLASLSQLYASGVLSADEFAAAKARLLGGADAPRAGTDAPGPGAAPPPAGPPPGLPVGPRPVPGPTAGANPNRTRVPIVAAMVIVVVIALVVASVVATISSSTSSDAASGGPPTAGSEEEPAAVSPGAGRSCPTSRVCINGGEGLVLGVVRATYEKDDVFTVPSLGANTRIAGDRWLVTATLEIGNLSGSSVPVDLSGLQIVTTSGAVASYFQSNSGFSIRGCPELSLPDLVRPGQWVSPPEQLCFLVPAGDTPAALQFGTFGGEEPLPADSF